MAEWEIDRVRYTLNLDNTPDLIVGIHWLVKAFDGEFVAETDGFLEFDPSHPINNEGYGSVTEDMCLEVVHDLLGEKKARIEQGLQDKLARQGIPEYGEGKPWKGSRKQWRTDLEVIDGDILAYQGSYYEVLQDHTTGSEWPPSESPELFNETVPPDVMRLPPRWLQPTGTIDAYSLGDRVRHEGTNWESLMDDNTAEPGTPGSEAIWIEVN